MDNNQQNKDHISLTFLVAVGGGIALTLLTLLILWTRVGVSASG